MPTTWTHQLPMRWADLDMLNHVNNVTYLEYAAESQALLTADGSLPSDRPGEVTVRFKVPMQLSRTPVTVVSHRDGPGLGQEICSGPDGSTVNARIVTTWDSVEAPPVPDGAESLDVRVRVGDVDARGAVTVPQAFELFQESRILLLANRLSRRAFGQFVAGTVTVRFHGDLRWRQQPYEAFGWLSRASNRSFTVETVIQDGGAPLLSATSMLVGFDLDTQQSRTFTDEECDILRGAVLV